MPTGRRQIEMTWKCSSCEHRNLGRYKTCQECGDPKDRSEKYEMPTDTSAAQTVTEAALLRMAEAGPNWRCAYCGSDQRNEIDATCAQCGASAASAEKVPAIAGGVGPRRAQDLALTPWGRMVDWLRAHMPSVLAARVVAWGRAHRVAVIVAGVALALIVGIWLWVHRTRTFTAEVVNATWTQTISVERYQIWARDGWRTEQPDGAFEVESKGEKVHHYDDVFDGYDTQHYTERVSCGEDCVNTAESCHESCSDNGNGFATCTTKCSGGGRSCTTRYCNEDRTRQVARYRKEPRYAEAIVYKIWDWGFQRKLDATGKGTTGLRWPVEEAHLGQGLGPREQEREQRSARYVITLAYDDTGKLVFDVPLDELPRFSVGSSHALVMKRGEPTLVDGKAVQPSP